MQNLRIIFGDCVESLREMPSDTVGGLVTDPPYDLTAVSFKGAARLGGDKKGFLGKSWDGTGIAFSDGFWNEVYRVLKPGGVVKAFSGTRTFHRMAAAMEQAGFVGLQAEAWAYGSGFPKSKDVALFLDKSAGAIGNRGRAIPTASIHLPGTGKYSEGGGGLKLTVNRVPPYEPITEAAHTWIGWGTGLKPAWEPVIVARKPE